VIYCGVDFSFPTPCPGVWIRADGEWDWNCANALLEWFDNTLEYGTTYRAAGWTIEPTREGTTFTNDATGHGMFVSVERVEPF